MTADEIRQQIEEKRAEATKLTREAWKGANHERQISQLNLEIHELKTQLWKETNGDHRTYPLHS